MKLSVIVLAFVLVGLALTSETTLASNNNQGEKATSADAKEARWQGHIIRVNKDKSTLSIRGGQSGHALQIETGIVKLRLVLQLVCLRLRQRGLEWCRIDFNDHVAGMHVLSLGEIDPLKDSVHLSLDRDGLHRLGDAIGGHDVWDGRAAHGSHANRNLR